jgi:two-component system CheB/CheR fusion protein
LHQNLGDLVSRLTYETLVADCREVLRTLVFKTAEVQTADGHWYLMRIMPYRTAENAINGLVITLVDINPVKAAERRLNLQRLSGEEVKKLVHELPVHQIEPELQNEELRKSQVELAGFERLLQ